MLRGPGRATAGRSGPTSAAPGGVGVPDTVQALIAARLDALGHVRPVAAAGRLGGRRPLLAGALVALEPHSPDLDAVRCTSCSAAA